MNKFDEVKSLIDEETAYIKYLGEPRRRGKSLWWKSPFRNERTASLVYTRGKGLHDFGTSKHYDIFSLVSELYNVSMLKALEIVENDFGISTSNPYMTDEIKSKLIKRQRYEVQKRKNIEKRFNEMFNSLCDEFKEWEEIRIALKNNPELEAYSVAINKTEYLNYLLDEMTNCTGYQEKEKFLKEVEYGYKRST